MDVRHSGKLNIKMEQLDECIGCETGAECDGAHRGEYWRYHPECCTRAAELERMQSKGEHKPPAYASVEAALHILDLEDRVKEQQKQIDSLREMMHNIHRVVGFAGVGGSSEQYYSRDRPKILAETFQQTCSTGKPHTLEQVAEHIKNGGNGTWISTKK